jgi:hypothetical protein
MSQNLPKYCELSQTFHTKICLSLFEKMFCLYDLYLPYLTAHTYKGIMKEII